VTTHNQQVVFLAHEDVEVSGALERAIKNAFDVRVICFIAGQKCLENIKKEKACDLLISSYSTVGMSGIALLRKTKRMFPLLPVVIISDMPDVNVAVRAMKLGALDFFQMPYSQTEFLRVVENALSFSSNVMPSKLHPLTPAEQTVLSLMLESRSTKEIARSRKRSVRTVEDQRQSMMHKLGVDNVIDLVKRFGSAHVCRSLNDE